MKLETKVFIMASL